MPKINYKYFIFFFLVFALVGSAQKRLVDSLERILNTTTEDSVKLHCLAYLSNICDVKEIKKYVEPASQLAEELLKNDLSPGTKKAVMSYKAMVLSNFGYFYDTQGNVVTALDYYQKSLTIFTELGQEKEMAYILSNMAYVYDSQGDVERSTDAYTKALNAMLKMNDKFGAANTIHNMGMLYFRKGDLNRTHQYYSRSLEMYEELNNVSGIVGVLNSLTTVLLLENRSDKALEYCMRSLKLSRDIDDEFAKTSTYVSAGNAYKVLKNYKLAKTYLDTAITLGKQYKFPEQLRDAENHMAEICAALGDHKESLTHYKLFIAYRDTISNDKSRKESMKNQFKVDFEQKEAILKVQRDKERIIAENKDRIQKAIIYSVIAGLLLVLVFSIFIFRSLQQNKKANIIISQQKKEVEEQKGLVEEKQLEILDSINYAKRIQYTLLAHDEFLKENLPEHFVYFDPKDIVSGDFYWAAKHGSKFYLAVCDSTGHGVPGAFMSLLNIGFLSEAIKEKNILKPNEIFNYVRERLIETVSRDGQRDGFDGILVCFDKTTKKVSYAAANNAPVIIRTNEFTILDADRMPVGKGEKGSDFTNHETQLQDGDTLYIYTDGYADQFGGAKGKKFKYKQLNELLLENSSKPLSEQKKILQQTFQTWKGNLEQVDDVCIIGLRI